MAVTIIVPTFTPASFSSALQTACAVLNLGSPEVETTMVIRVSFSERGVWMDVSVEL